MIAVPQLLRGPKLFSKYFLLPTLAFVPMEPPNLNHLPHTASLNVYSLLIGEITRPF